MTLLLITSQSATLPFTDKLGRWLVKPQEDDEALEALLGRRTTSASAARPDTVEGAAHLLPSSVPNGCRGGSCGRFQGVDDRS